MVYNSCEWLEVVFPCEKLFITTLFTANKLKITVTNNSHTQTHPREWSDIVMSWQQHQLTHASISLVKVFLVLDFKSFAFRSSVT